MNYNDSMLQTIENIIIYFLESSCGQTTRIKSRYILRMLRKYNKKISPYTAHLLIENLLNRKKVFETKKGKWVLIKKGKKKNSNNKTAYHFYIFKKRNPMRNTNKKEKENAKNKASKLIESNNANNKAFIRQEQKESEEKCQ